MRRRLVWMAVWLVGCAGGSGASSDFPDAWDVEDDGVLSGDPGAAGDPLRDGASEDGAFSEKGPESEDAQGDLEDETVGDVGSVDPGQAGCPDDPGEAPSPGPGFILLDPDDHAVQASIEAAARFGVRHVQMSHDLIMDLDEIVGEGEEVDLRVARLNRAISMAHSHGLKAYVWTHEFPEGAIVVCYGPEGDIWARRREVWRRALERIPEVDGVVLMFGSAGTPPWFTICDCEWCWDRWGQDLQSPPQGERLRLITEHLGEMLVRDLGKELIARVFVHEPEENDWHREGFGSVSCLPLATMHKDSVNDWQPYNPFDPTMPVANGVPGLMETDVAGEYWGQGVLPFVAPGYFRWRLSQARERGAVGWAARIERGSHHALGTPNEVNLWALKSFWEDPETPMEVVFGRALEALYGVPPDSEAARILQGVLESTFPVRLKSHYALGIWALEKGSDLPGSPAFGQFFTRGDMRKWDRDWTAVWESLDRPDKGTVLRLWQEGSEAVELAEEALATFQDRRAALETAGVREALLEDLERRLRHQFHGAHAWRAVDLFLWSARAWGQGNRNPDLASFMAYAVQQLRRTADRMEVEGLGEVPLASPARMREFADRAESGVPEGASPGRPPGPWISPLRILEVRPDRVTLRFTTAMPGEGTLEWGTEMPDFEGDPRPLGMLDPGVEVRVDLEGLRPGSRYLARIRLVTAEVEMVGGETWVFTPFR